MRHRARRWAVMLGIGAVLVLAGQAWATQPADANVMHRPVFRTR